PRAPLDPRERDAGRDVRHPVPEDRPGSGDLRGGHPQEERAGHPARHRQGRAAEGIGLTGSGLGPRLAEELSRYLPTDLLGPLSLNDTLTAPWLADRAIRELLPRALEGRGAPEAASRIRALPAVTGADVARTVQPSLERIARATQAPPDLIRAAAQVSGAL